MKRHGGDLPQVQRAAELRAGGSFKRAQILGACAYRSLEGMWPLFPVPGALEIPLRGPKGEPVDFARTIVSHGVAELPPNKVDLPGRTHRPTYLT